MPWKLRQHGHFDPTFQTYAWVTGVRRSQQVGMRMVGLEFIGPHLPAGYLEKPWAIYRPPGWNGAERRRAPREARAENVWVSYPQRCLSSRCHKKAGGRRISVATVPACVSKLLRRIVTCSSSRPLIAPSESLALVADQYLGTDGFYRLCVQFIGQEWPLPEAHAKEPEEPEDGHSNDQTVKEADEPAATMTVEAALQEISATLKACQGGSCDEPAVKRMHRATAIIRRAHGSLLDVSDLLNAIEYAADNLYGPKELGPFGVEKLRMRLLSDYIRLTNFLAARGLFGQLNFQHHRPLDRVSPARAWSDHTQHGHSKASSGRVVCGKLRVLTSVTFLRDDRHDFCLRHV